jgi:hypothetical protein
LRPLPSSTAGCCRILLLLLLLLLCCILVCMFLAGLLFGGAVLFGWLDVLWAPH